MGEKKFNPDLEDAPAGDNPELSSTETWEVADHDELMKRLTEEKEKHTVGAEKGQSQTSKKKPKWVM